MANAKKKWNNEERELLAKQMDLDLQEFIAEKIEANKDKPKEPYNFDKMMEVGIVLKDQWKK